MSDTPWSIGFTGRADKDIQRLDHTVRSRVIRGLEALASDPDSRSLRKLTGRAESRLRVGDSRVLIELDRQTRTIIVHRVLPRGRAYDR